MTEKEPPLDFVEVCKILINISERYKHEGKSALKLRVVSPDGGGFEQSLKSTKTLSKS